MVASALDVATLAELPEVARRSHGSKTAIIVDGESQTYEAFASASGRVAGALARDGVTEAERVAIVARDSLPSLSVLFGAARSKAVSVPVNWRLSPDEVSFILRDARPRRVFFDPEFGALVAAALAGLEQPPAAVSLSEEAQGFPALARWGEGAPAGPPSLTHHPDDVAVQMYTSGTTGRPKGVRLAHRSFFALPHEMARRADPWIGWTEDDVTLGPLPTFHIGGLWWIVRGLALRNTNVLLRGFDPAAVLDAIQRYRVTRTCMVPAMIQMVVMEPGCEATDFSSLRTIVYGGAPIATTLLERARKTFGCDFCQVYGLTETGNMAVCLRPADHLQGGTRRLLAAGRPFPGVQVRIVKRDGETAAPGEVGEILLRSPAQMVGYWERPEATASTLADGWVHTGDGGYLDEEGFLYVCDRMKDMIICAGENIYPAEIENALRHHDGVADAAVVGVPDELWGEAVLAFVVPRAGATLTPRDVMRHARGHLADFKVPKEVRLVSDLPRTASGKVMKAKLREPFWAGRVRQVN